MGKMRGNWLLVLVLILTSYAWTGPSLQLEVVSLDGDSLAVVGAGQPFVLRVTSDGMNGNCNEPTVEGLGQLEVENKRFAMHTIGQQSTIIHSYTVRIDLPGSYIIGPALIKDSTGQIIKSDALTISVGSTHSKKKKPSKNKHYTPKQKHPPYFLRVYANTETAYVGERIECAVRLYYDKKITPQPVEQRSDLKKIGLTLVSNENSQTCGEKEIDGKRYGYYQWKFDVISEKVGRVVLPAFNTLVPVDSAWPSFFMAQSLKRIYSNAIALNIVPVECDEPFDAVGRFTSLTATVNPGAARQGNAMTLTVALEGDKNVANLEHFDVKNVPKGLRLYESAQRVEPLSNGRGYIKQFEFVLHGVDSGEWEIPEQSLAYFDLTDHRCKTIMSPALLVTVLPGHQTQEHQKIDESVGSNLQNKKTIRDIVTSSNSDNIKVRMPWWLFLVLLFPVFIIPIGSLAKTFYASYGAEYVDMMRRWFSFFGARYQIRSVQRVGNCEKLYGVFIKLFALRMQTAENSITKEMTVQTLRSKGLDPVLVSQWSTFFYELERASFEDAIDSPCNELCKQSLRWVSIIEKVL